MAHSLLRLLAAVPPDASVELTVRQPPEHLPMEQRQLLGVTLCIQVSVPGRAPVGAMTSIPAELWATQRELTLERSLGQLVEAMLTVLGL